MQRSDADLYATNERCASRVRVRDMLNDSMTSLMACARQRQTCVLMAELAGAPMSPVANMAGDAVRETARMAAAPAWKAWADSRSARATTATDFMWLCARQRQRLTQVFWVCRLQTGPGVC
jgi:hypothetical protein